jgi:hypothetical protein
MGGATLELGKCYEQANQYAKACPWFDKYLEKKPDDVGQRMEAAKCYEQADLLATAWERYLRAAATAASAGNHTTKKDAETRMTALESKVAHLTISVPPEVRALQGLQVWCDDVAVGSEVWDVRPLMKDQGKHVLKATATGMDPWETTIVLKDGDAQTAPIGPLLKAKPPVDPPQPPGPDPLPDPAKVRRTAGFALGATGLASVALGGVFGGLAIAKKSASNAPDPSYHNFPDCVGDTCNTTGLELRAQGVNFGNASTALFVLGGAALATGVVLLVTAPVAAKPATAIVAVGPRGMEVQGVW